MTNKYKHILHIVSTPGRTVISVDRVFEGGNVDHYTEIEIPVVTKESRWDTFDLVALQLGRSLLIDCPDARTKLLIDSDDEACE